MKNTLIVLCLVLIAAGIAASGWMLSKPNPLNGEIERLETELKDARTEIAKLKVTLEKQKIAAVADAGAGNANPTSVNRGAQPPSASMMTRQQGMEPAEANTGADASGKSVMRLLVDKPEMKEMVKQTNLAQIDMKYGRLFDAFQLNPEETENFKQLLAERLSAGMDIALKLMDESLTTEQRNQIFTDLETAKKASDEAIKTFLNYDDDYKIFQHWEDTEPERTTLEMLGGRSHFVSAGEPLTPDQEQKLVDVMATIRKSPSTVPGINKPKGFDPAILSDQGIQQQLQIFDRDAQTAAQNAAGFLSATQLQALAKMQQQMRALTEIELKMSAAMMKGGK